MLVLWNYQSSSNKWYNYNHFKMFHLVWNFSNAPFKYNKGIFCDLAPTVALSSIELYISHFHIMLALTSNSRFQHLTEHDITNHQSLWTIKVLLSMRFFAFITQPICHLMMLYKYFFFRSFFFQCRSVGHITGLNKKPTYRYNTVLYCYLATSSIREEVSQFTTAVNSFHPALKYTWEISNTFFGSFGHQNFNWRQRSIH